MTKLNWNKAKVLTRTLSLEDEKEHRGQDRAAKWLKAVEGKGNHFQNGSGSSKPRRPRRERRPRASQSA